MKPQNSNKYDTERHQDGGQQSACQSVGRQFACRRQADRDRSCIQMFQRRSDNQSYGTWQCYSRAEEEAESARLIEIAKIEGLYFTPEESKKLGFLYSRKTGESEVYANEELGLVFKVNSPFAKRVLKDLHPSDAIYEHIIHNILFPNARYNFVGITEYCGEVRIIKSQRFCYGSLLPTQQEIEKHLASLGLLPEGYYYYGNDYLSVTDVNSESDNVLKDELGHLYFIDPIFKLKRPAQEVIEWLLSDESPLWNTPKGTIKPHLGLWQKIKQYFSS